MKRKLMIFIATILLGPGQAAAQLPGEAQRGEALAGLQSGNADVRLGASVVLGEIGKPADLPALMGALHDRDNRVRQAAEGAIWRVWGRSGDPQADRMFDRGVAQMQSGNLRQAVETFSGVIRMKPEFAEGWNKRATVYFLLGEDDLSLKDCDEVLKRNQQHFGVLAGYGQIYIRKGDLERALDYFERALAINPNLQGVRDTIAAIERALVERRRKFI